MNTSTDLHTIMQSEPRLRQLYAVLMRVQGRLRTHEAISFMPVALSLGLGAALLLIVVWRFDRIMPLWAALSVGAGFALSAGLTTFLYARLRRRDLMSTARRADRMLALDERLSTALEDAARPLPNPTHEQMVLRDAQLDDALASVAGISVSRDLPLKVERRGAIPVGLFLALILAAILVPNPFTSASERAVQAQIGVEQRQIERVREAVSALPLAATDPTLQELLKELDELSSDLGEEGLSREAAMARLSEAEKELQKALDPQAPAERAALEELAKQLAGSDSEAARQAGEALKSGDPQKAAEALKDAGKKAGEMSAEQKKELAEALRQSRDSVVAMDPEMAQALSEAADALESNDPQAAEKALENAAQQIEQKSQNAASQEQVRQALAQIQQSKSDIAQAGQPTPSANQIATAIAQATNYANGTPLSGTPLSGTPLSGTAIAAQGSPVSGTAQALSGTPLSGTPGTPMVAGSPVQGQLSGTGTPVLMQGTPGTGTPVVGQGQGQGQGQGSGGQGDNPGGQGWGTGRSEPVYAPPSSVNAATTAVSVQGQNNPGGEQSSTTTNADVNNTGQSQVPYEQVYGQYAEQAGNALDSDYIPQGYKDLVRDYFTNIEPPKP